MKNPEQIGESSVNILKAIEDRYMEEIKHLKYGKCIRLYNEKGDHILSVERCLDDETYFDLATPDGKVLCCSPVSDFWPVIIAENFPVEEV